jgi:DNA modification methylase
MPIREKPGAQKNKNKAKPKSLEGMTNPPMETPGATAISDLRPAGYNPRSISAEKLEMLKKAMEEFGDLGGVVFNTKTGRLVGGHQRVKNLESTWPIIKEAHTDNAGTTALGYVDTPHGRWTYREVCWPESKEKAANIAANAHGGDWDEDLLTQLLAELYQSGADMDLTGFDQAELNAILGIGTGEKLGPEDKDTPPMENPWVKKGDLWQCGPHRILCGDSLNLADVDRLLDKGKADMVWVDPPYNVDYEGTAGKIMNDKMTPAQFYEFLLSMFSAMHYALKPGGCFYIAHAEGNGTGDIFRRAVNGIPGLMMKQCLIWVKNSAVLCRQDYNWKHEPILYGWKEGAGHFFNQDFTQTTVIDDDVDLSRLDKKALQAIITDLRNAIPTSIIRADKPTKSDLHPTQKPVYLVGKNIVASSEPDQVVLDLCGGSGTTMIASRKHGRRARLMELDPRFAQAIICRYMDYCGEEPELIHPDGARQPLSAVERERRGSKA